jgi:uncharacterized protein (TIGR00661 family)
MGKMVLQTYAPSSAQYGFHFWGNQENIFTPVIRQQIRNLQVSDKGHYTVYLPAYDDRRLVKRLSAFKQTKWQVFSKHNQKPVEIDNIKIQPINNEVFTESLATSSGIICGAGFETPAEALHLGKKLLVIPMKSQYEQHLNAAALEVLGVPVLKSLKPKHHDFVSEWMSNGLAIKINYPDITQQIVDEVIHNHRGQ